MDLNWNDLGKVGVGAGGAGFIYAAAKGYSMVYGSGKERLDFQATSRNALEAQAKSLQNHVNDLFARENEIRKEHIAAITALEARLKKIEEDRDAWMVKAVTAEAELRNSNHREIIKDSELARLRTQSRIPPEIYPQGFPGVQEGDEV